ncbi:hypothetical protein T4A_8108 [Trichinella pseudospiralis]|uniref:Uncharacterized protein n=1 Tax=Trichinella pseudospiralis TaxID=6337 RepID=A0A0V1DV51_TRIPS|nr:hypothetical protein T4A_8108 [Trichinella pseudospiralis]
MHMLWQQGPRQVVEDDLIWRRHKEKKRLSKCWFLHKDIVAQNCGTHWTIRECLPRESVRPQRRMRKADFQQDGDNE